MRALFRICFDVDHEDWWNKKQIFDAITRERDEGNDDLAYFGDLVHEPEAKKAKTRTGMVIKEFNSRVFGGIKMSMDKSSSNSGRHRVRFERCR